MSTTASPSRVSGDDGGGTTADGGQEDEGAAAAKFNFPAFEELTGKVMGDAESLTVLERLKIQWKEKYGYSGSGTTSAIAGALMEVASSPIRTEGCGLESTTPTEMNPTYIRLPAIRVSQGLMPATETIVTMQSGGSPSTERWDMILANVLSAKTTGGNRNNLSKFMWLRPKETGLG
ncbi:hypothetical protein Salat_2728900 [Sesamum alatum]|uniref:Uncharacterized protein n=1 Tax=Sesamum alatum TaxID=300844 RepID=A0AAE2C8N5_9LAMI|nr:hypothetical protein Salat_2728900 [Sesamum alatum]